MVQMAFCDLLHTFHKQVTSVSQHVFVILLWGILKFPLTSHNVTLIMSPLGWVKALVIYIGELIVLLSVLPIYIVLCTPQTGVVVLL